VSSSGTRTPKAWAFHTKTHATGISIYDDVIDSHYSYNSNVPNSQQVQAGDLVVVRQDNFVAGWALIQSVDVTPNCQIMLTRCPACRSTALTTRVTKALKYRCGRPSCKLEFGEESALLTQEIVTNYRANYPDTWNEAAVPQRRQTLENFTMVKNSQNAIRPLDGERIQNLLAVLSQRTVNIRSEQSALAEAEIIGGFKEAMVLRRRGQREFRFRLLERVGAECAVLGPQPPQVLEAAHIQSFATTGKHDLDGGLILRRDIHTLFDAHLLTIDPDNMRVQVAPKLRIYKTYESLQSAPLHLAEHHHPKREFLEEHFERSMETFRVS